MPFTTTPTRRRPDRSRLLASLLLALALGPSLALVPAAAVPDPGVLMAPSRPPVSPPPRPQVAPPLPLAGKVVVIDPGHQLGNFSHPRQIRRQVDAGGFQKACNSTGTATDSGYRESAFTMSVANFLRARLEAQGATVHLTRPEESRSLWGPCVDVRGMWGADVDADAMVSVHGDGTLPQYHGFFVIRPAWSEGWTDDIYASSRTLSTDIRRGLQTAGLDRANYNGGDGLDTRDDLGTLNWSDVPVVMVELGNMRNADDAEQMRSAVDRDEVFAAGLAAGLERFLDR